MKVIENIWSKADYIYLCHDGFGGGSQVAQGRWRHNGARQEVTSMRMIERSQELKIFRTRQKRVAEKGSEVSDFEFEIM